MSECISNVQICCWSPGAGREPPRVDQVRHCLRNHQFPVGRAVDIPVTTAFRRAIAAKAAENKDCKATVRAMKENGLIGQIDEITVDENRITRRRVDSWVLDSKTGDVSPYLDLGPFLNTYTWGDLGPVLRTIFKEDLSGTYPVKNGSGVYFAPVANGEVLDRLGAACRDFGLNILRTSIPSTDEWRAEISNSIALAFTDEIELHRVAVAAYSADTRPGIMENRREGIRCTYNALGRVRELCQGKYPELCESMRLILGRIGEIELEIQAAADAVPAPSGRVVMV